MLNYIYDGSFEGLLTAVFEAYYRHEMPHRVIADGNTQQSFVDTSIYITTDSEKAGKVYNSIHEKISPEALEDIYYVYLSEFEDAGTTIYNYLRLGWKIGKDVDKFLSNDIVLKVAGIKRKVSFERHRFLGLLRFRQLDDNLFYAPIEPDHNIVELLAPHFADRLSDQNWIIHDRKRGIAAIYNRERWVITDVSAEASPGIGEAEAHYQKLWKQYFSSIAISYRKNPRLQKNHMPVRYWRNLTEMQKN